MISERNLDSIAVTGAAPALAAELVAELREARTQLAALRSWADGARTDIEGLETENDVLLAQRQAALDLHSQRRNDNACVKCGHVYPCATRRALEGRTP